MGVQMKSLRRRSRDFFLNPGGTALYAYVSSAGAAEALEHYPTPVGEQLQLIFDEGSPSYDT